MNDLKTAVQRCDSSSLATMFDLGRDTDLRSPETMQEALEHLLSLPIENALNQLPRELADNLRRRSTSLKVGSNAGQSRINTFGELFNHPHPPIEMLKFAKEFGKDTIVHKKTVWPGKVCEVLYYASYAAALVRCRERIGSLSNIDLKNGFRKLASRPWITNELRELFAKAGAQLAKAESGK